MSVPNAPCIPVSKEGADGAGEMTCGKIYGGSSNPVNIIASEIMNTIVDKAMTIVLEKQKEQKQCKKICPNVVGDIIDNILSPSPQTEKSNETVLLNDDLKKIINEMKYPPDEVCSRASPPKDIGDHVAKSEMRIQPKVSAVEAFKRNTLERKKRLTKLVKSKFKMTESEKDDAKNPEDDVDVEDNVGNCSGSTKPFLVDGMLDVVDLKHDQESDNIDGGDQGNEKKESAKKKWNIKGKLLKYLKKTSGKEKKEEVASSD